MKCVHCRKAKAKRYCPAKDDEICPKCCGEFRGIEINCPLDCEYFIEGQKNHQERIDKLRVQKEGIKTYVKVFINDRDIDDLDTPITDGPVADATVYILPASMGG